MALINDEAIRENGDENLNMAGIVDISDEKRPRMLSLFPLPEPAPESELKNFYEKRAGSARTTIITRIIKRASKIETTSLISRISMLD